MSLLRYTLKSLFFDRMIIVLICFIGLYAFVPIFSYFSMRQLQEISITMSLSLNSFILLLMAIFGGTITIWRDIERKYTYTVVSYPISRTNYLLQRFVAIVLVLLIITIVNAILGYFTIKISASLYKSDLPLQWDKVFIAYIATFLKYTLLLSFTFLFASFSTSFFTPIFLTMAVYLIGNATQGMFDFVTKEGSDFNLFIKNTVIFAYYTFPNFSSFDYTAYASYSLPLEQGMLTGMLIYFVIYTSIVLVSAIIIFNKRDLY
ncbi:MAG: ABC transporter permease [Calditerrivibrio sp.]|nr:ABC transporter permease [Calditerrivibrio sp.]